MSRNAIAAWTLAAVITTTGVTTVFANERENGNEEKVTYRSSIQVPAGLEKQSELQKLARITKKDAARAAQSVAKGTVGETKLENEENNLVYTVELTTKSGTTEVIVDAGTGKVLATDADSEEKKDGENEND